MNAPVHHRNGGFQIRELHASKHLRGPHEKKPPVSRTRPRENQLWVASGWCGRVSDLLCTSPLHRPTCILQTESQNLSRSKFTLCRTRADLTDNV